MSSCQVNVEIKQEPKCWYSFKRQDKQTKTYSVSTKIFAITLSRVESTQAAADKLKKIN